MARVSGQIRRCASRYTKHASSCFPLTGTHLSLSHHPIISLPEIYSPPVPKSDDSDDAKKKNQPQTTQSVTRKLITFRCTGGGIHKCDRAGEESVAQLPQASDEVFLLVKAASGPLVHLIELQIKIQACLDANS